MPKKLCATMLAWCLLLCLTAVSTAQEIRDPDENVRRAAECLRGVSGLIEGSAEDVANDNAHFTVFQSNRGRIGMPRTIIRLHPGVSRGLFHTFDNDRVRQCMRGLRPMPRQ